MSEHGSGTLTNHKPLWKYIGIAFTVIVPVISFLVAFAWTQSSVNAQVHRNTERSMSQEKILLEMVEFRAELRTQMMFIQKEIEEVKQELKNNRE